MHKTYTVIAEMEEKNTSQFPQVAESLTAALVTVVFLVQNWRLKGLITCIIVLKKQQMC